MKFLCVPCDQPMRLTKPPEADRGSLSIVYACDACGYEMAMLTNAYETQVVQSLGVKIGLASFYQEASCIEGNRARGQHLLGRPHCGAACKIRRSVKRSRRNAAFPGRRGQQERWVEELVACEDGAKRHARGAPLHAAANHR